MKKWISVFIDEIILRHSTNWADHLIRLIDSQATIMLKQSSWTWSAVVD
ncbi:hypothetical protein [Moraxella lincolnii]|nr:hypothetical protein [Moraxella lincolnii]